MNSNYDIYQSGINPSIISYAEILPIDINPNNAQYTPGIVPPRKISEEILFERINALINSFDPIETIFYNFSGPIGTNINLNGIPNDKNLIFIVQDSENSQNDKRKINIKLSTTESLNTFTLPQPATNNNIQIASTIISNTDPLKSLVYTFPSFAANPTSKYFMSTRGYTQNNILQRTIGLNNMTDFFVPGGQFNNLFIILSKSPQQSFIFDLYNSNDVPNPLSSRPLLSRPVSSRPIPSRPFDFNPLVPRIIPPVTPVRAMRANSLIPSRYDRNCVINNLQTANSDLNMTEIFALTSNCANYNQDSNNIEAFDGDVNFSAFNVLICIIVLLVIYYLYYQYKKNHHISI